MVFAHLFQPGSIGRLAVANRVVMPAMATNFASSVGEPTDRLIGYYAERARGGVGLVIVENATIEHRRGGNGAVQLRIDEDRYVPGLHHLVEAIRSEGAAAAIQINHAGAVARAGAAPIAPSNVSWSETSVEPQALAVEDVETLIADYAQAAVRARRAGFDAVEIHGAHGYLIAQFLSPLMNRRTDDYGGSPENRWRFALDVVRAVREAVGSDYPLLFRVSGDEYLPGGRTIDETRDLAQALVRAGVDAIHVSAATSVNPEKQLEPMSFPEAWRADLAEAVKRVVDIPVIAVGVIRTPETADRVLADGKADFVAIGRGLIADPNWPRKAAKGETIRRCISCNRCVRHRVFDDLPIRCSVNPQVGWETEVLPRSEQSRHVLVIGGGPAGLSAATAAAERGQRVTLCEAASELGGRLRLAAVPPHKEKIGWLIEDLMSALPESVEVRTDKLVAPGDLAALHPDVAILAVGALPRPLDTPGAELPHVVSADAVLGGAVDVSGSRIVVIGGGMVGCETASFCAEAACSVVVVEMADGLALDCEPITRGDLLKRLTAQGIELRSGTAVLEITPSQVVVDGAGTQCGWETDWVVVAVGMEPDCELQQALEGGDIPILSVGDARDARGICEAVAEGWLAGAAWAAEHRPTA